MRMDITFPGGKRVHSSYKGFTVATDQPRSEGGNGSAPEPYDLFLASIGTCAGVYVVYFCEERGIDPAAIRMSLQFERNEKTHLTERVRIHLELPPEFPAKYKTALTRAAGVCTVKRNILDPPEFLVTADFK